MLRQVRTFCAALLVLTAVRAAADCNSQQWTPTSSSTVISCGSVGVSMPAGTVPNGPFQIYADNMLSFACAGCVPSGKHGLEMYYGPANDAGVLQAIYSGTAYKPLLLNPSGGNVGVGMTMGSAAAAPLHVAGSTTIQGYPVTMLVGSAAALNKRLMFGYDTTANYGFIASEEDGVQWTPLVLNPGGKVGIGTNAPAQLLDIETPAQNGTPSTVLRVGTTTTAYAGSGGAIELAAMNNSGAVTPVGKIAAWLTNGAAGAQAGDVVISTSNAGALAERMRIHANGLVDINGATLGNDPSDKLIVNGSIRAVSVIGATYQDVAEWVPASESIAPGTVVIVDADAVNGVAPSKRPYDTAVAGVISAQPGVLLGKESPSSVKVATTGRVKVRVDASRGAIRAGDLLVTSEKPGVAMRSEPVEVAGVRMHRPGTLIGKALQPLESGEGEILVLLSLQ